MEIDLAAADLFIKNLLSTAPASLCAIELGKVHKTAAAPSPVRGHAAGRDRCVGHVKPDVTNMRGLVNTLEAPNGPLWSKAG
ncbi:uncharacterized protein BBA_08399 [Beauveria bassiana ARSEF 2860]|uniref:Uncharacterized protein n=1 Tax=Beauveria bassiana (strain ARSEF 2860) TaxID=655819 RepID=J4KLR9_BEAB2|nr:uncharacterized protein BBA_08399 [Beauveria bassiana ARSEF 2860]EJP62684.1 hypothetical protein BBA_08399 [Beauveria bassiana ARSEF 2860]